MAARAEAATYRDVSGHRDRGNVLPPFFAFRAPVVAPPRRYPTLSHAVRVTVPGFARAMAASEGVDPRRVDAAGPRLR
jgi:hypothetical protein